MAQVTFSSSSFQFPGFAAEELAPKTLLNSGARLNPAGFSLVDSKKPVEAGTLVGRTFAERDAAAAFGPAVIATDDEIYLTAFTVVDTLINPDVTLIRHNTLIYEDRLPGWSGMDADTKTKIRSLYQCVKSAG